jgi:hypothetical protein
MTLNDLATRLKVSTATIPRVLSKPEAVATDAVARLVKREWDYPKSTSSSAIFEGRRDGVPRKKFCSRKSVQLHSLWRITK